MEAAGGTVNGLRKREIERNVNIQRWCEKRG